MSSAIRRPIIAAMGACLLAGASCAGSKTARPEPPAAAAEASAPAAADAEYARRADPADQDSAPGCAAKCSAEREALERAASAGQRDCLYRCRQPTRATHYCLELCSRDTTRMAEQSREEHRACLRACE